VTIVAGATESLATDKDIDSISVLNSSDTSDPDSDRDIGSDGNSSHILRKGHSHMSFLPCLLKTHTYWITHRQRLLIGAEKLAAQGFPPYIETAYVDPDGSQHEISDAQLSSIAGNTISIPVIGSMMFLALACTRLRLKGGVSAKA